MAFSFYYPSTNYFTQTGQVIDISRVIVNTEPSDIIYYVYPSLPSNLYIDASNGSILGTTSYINQYSLATYTVTGIYNSGLNSTDASFNLSVHFLPIFLYDKAFYIIQLNNSIQTPPIFPTIFINSLPGVIYTISPLSNNQLTTIGMNLSSTNGKITGTPTTLTNPTDYVIRANNNGITYDTSLNISVQVLPTVSYLQTRFSLTQGVYASIIPISNTTNATYSIKGCPLPLGLFLNTQTGEIFGTPTLLTTFREYVVTISNIIGSTSTIIILNVIKVFLAPPVVGDNFSGGLCLTNIDIAMRRKAEILKYKKNSANISKNQNWSNVIQGKGPLAKRAWANQNDLGSNPNISGLDQEGNIIICNSNGIVCSPTSSSNVPGPIMNLCYNPAIPLVGYVAPNRTKVNIGFKWPQRAWTIGNMGFPVGKSGT